ncbi:MAG: glutamate--tRNA ligase, partial [Alphaproteobacteria bacterium]|nr:glutamate--tRNA ligase [Alphaproteobacteria bacterium]
RNGDASFQDLVAKGYLPEAILNYIALLGWNPGDEREIFSLQELEKCFSSERLNKSPAIFDITKLTWMNGCYIRNLSAEDFHALALPYYKELPQTLDFKALSAVLQPRVETLAQIPTETAFLAQVPAYSNELYINKKMKTDTDIACKALELVLPVLSGVTDWNNETLFETLKGVAVASEMKNGQILYPVRIALSGQETTPGGATELACVLGKAETIKRIENAINKLKQ